MVVAAGRQHAVGGGVELEPGQHVLVADAAAGVLVHDLDQLGDGAGAVADHVAGHAAGGGDELAVDDQQPVVVALDHALDHDAAAFRLRRSRRRAATSSSVVRFTETPRPWLPSTGLTTTGKPMRLAAVTASSASRTWRCFGTGRPRSASRRVQSSLSEAISTAVCEVWLVSAASMRFWYLPWPTWIRLASFSRSQGMSRASAALTSASAEGPSERRLAKCSKSAMASAMSRRFVARGDELQDDAAGDVAGLEPDRFGFVAVEHLDLLGVRGGAGRGELGRRAGGVLQRDRDLGHQLAETAVGLGEALGQRRAVFGAGGGEAGQVAQQRLDERVGVVGDRGGGAAVQVHGQADQRLLGVDVGADIDGGRDDLHDGSPCDDEPVLW